MSFRFYQAKQGDLVHVLKTNEWFLLTRLTTFDESGARWLKWNGINLATNKEQYVFHDWNAYEVQSGLDLYRDEKKVDIEAF